MSLFGGIVDRPQNAHDFGLDLTVTGLDAASLQRIRETLDAARKAGLEF